MEKTDMNDANDIDFSGKGDNGEELTMDDLTSKFIKNPKVGESIVLPVAKIVKNKNVKFKSKDGVQINKSLSSVDFNYEIFTTDDRVYTCNSWEVFGKIKDICRNLGKTKGFTIKITHLKDGKIGKKGGMNYDVTLVAKTA
jgi:hypothetical protein